MRLRWVSLWLVVVLAAVSGAPDASAQPADDGTEPAAPADPTIDPAADPTIDPSTAAPVEPAGEPAPPPPHRPEPPPRPAPATGAAPDAAPEAKPELTEAEQSQGTCRNPREAWLQLLFWLQRGTRWDPTKAAACFDVADLADPAKDAPRLARELKEALDANGAMIRIKRIPDDPEYLDPKSGLHRYRDAVAGEHIDHPISVVRVGDRWLFSRDTLKRIPEMGPPLSGTLRRILPDWSRKTFLGVELWSYGGIVLLIFVALLVQKVVVFLIGTYLRRLLGQSKFIYLDNALRRADRPIGGMVMALVFYVGFPMLLFPLRVSELAFIATEALAAYSGVWLAYRLIDVLSDFMAAKAANTDTKLDDQLVPLLTKTLKVFVSVIGGIFILQNMSVDVGSLLAGLGLGGLAFALAARDTVANFFGSVMIFIDKPFQIGDWISMSGTEGVIEEVGFRTSRVRTFYNSVVTVPNGMVVNQIVDNYGRRQYRRYSTTLGLTYGTPPEKVQAFCEGVRAIIARLPGMRKDYYLVEFKDFGSSALEIMVYCFMVAPTWNEELRTRTLLNLEIMKLAKELGVSFAYPTQTLHVETLPNPGEARPQHSGSSDPGRLTGVIDQFNQPREPDRLSRGYYCDSKKVQAGDGDGGA